MRDAQKVRDMKSEGRRVKGRGESEGKRGRWTEGEERRKHI